MRIKLFSVFYTFLYIRRRSPLNLQEGKQPKDSLLFFLAAAGGKTSSFIRSFRAKQISTRKSSGYFTSCHAQRKTTWKNSLDSFLFFILGGFSFFCSLIISMNFGCFRPFLAEYESIISPLFHAQQTQINRFFDRWPKFLIEF